LQGAAGDAGSARHIGNMIKKYMPIRIQSCENKNAINPKYVIQTWKIHAVVRKTGSTLTYTRSEILTAVKMSMAVFWVVTP
jgi:hypothetical protein